jgi:hypothetical protein
MLTRPAALVFAVVDLLTALLLGFGVFVALPARFAPVDAAATVLIVAQLVAAGALVAGASWANRAAAVAALATLLLGLGLVSTLALTASWLSGVYGPVGRGGAIILILVALLSVPYLVALPALQLFWMRPRDGASS